MQILYLGFFAAVLIVWAARAPRILRAYMKAPRVGGLGLPLSSAPEMVSIIVPAKNEENNIEACIQSLLLQDYPAFEIIIVNDNSADSTEDIIRRLGARPVYDSATGQPDFSSKLRYLNCPCPPQGWTGKNHALHHAIPYARGRWLLFTDADTRHERSSISATMNYALVNNISLLTLLPRCITGSAKEHIIQPAAMSFTGLWFPIDHVNAPGKNVYFGNGQYLLVERKLYDELGGHNGVRAEFLEDFALFKKAKENGYAAACAVAPEVFGTRMYDSMRGMWKGWRRIYLHAFKSNPLLIMRKALGVFTFAVLPFALFAALICGAGCPGETPVYLWSIAALTVGIMLFTTYYAYGIIKAKKAFCVFFPFASFFIFLLLLDALKMSVTGQKTLWR